MSKSIKERMGDSGWWCLRTDPPPNSIRGFWVGSASGGRRDFVFRWPYRGKLWYWCKGENGNYPIDDYGFNVWYPEPPPIPGSAVARFQETNDPNELVR